MATDNKKEEAQIKEEENKLILAAKAVRWQMKQMNLQKVAVGVKFDFYENSAGILIEQDPTTATEVKTDDNHVKATSANLGRLVKITNYVHAMLLNWKVAATLKVELHIGIITLIIEAEIKCIEDKAISQERQRLLEREWGSMDVSGAKKFILLPSELTRVKGATAKTEALPSSLLFRNACIGFGKLKDRLIANSKAVESAGFKGNVTAEVKVGIPTALTFGIDTCSIKIEVKIPVTTMLAAAKSIELDYKQRTEGNLVVKVAGAQGLSNPKFETYVVLWIEGSPRDAMKRTASKAGATPAWNEEITLPCAAIGKGEFLIMTLYNKELPSDKYLDEWIIPVDKLQLQPGAPKDIAVAVYPSEAVPNTFPASYLSFEITWKKK